MKNTTVSYTSNELIFGFPVEVENESTNVCGDQVRASLVPVPTAATVPAVAAEEMNVVYGEENLDFYDAIEILAHVEDVEFLADRPFEVTAAPIAHSIPSATHVYPIPHSNITWIEYDPEVDSVYAALAKEDDCDFCYEAEPCDKKEMNWESSEKLCALSESYMQSKTYSCIPPDYVSVIDGGYCLPSFDSQNLALQLQQETEIKRNRRLEAIVRWRQKRSAQLNFRVHSNQGGFHQIRKKRCRSYSHSSAASGSRSIVSRVLGKGLRHLTISKPSGSNFLASNCSQVDTVSNVEFIKRPDDIEEDTYSGSLNDAVSVDPLHSPDEVLQTLLPERTSVSTLSSTRLNGAEYISTSSELWFPQVKPSSPQSTITTEYSTVMTEYHKAATGVDTEHTFRASRDRGKDCAPDTLSNCDGIIDNDSTTVGTTNASVSQRYDNSNVLPSARQQATARRLREKGRFKKAQITWVSVTDLFFGS